MRACGRQPVAKVQRARAPDERAATAGPSAPRGGSLDRSVSSNGQSVRTADGRRRRNGGESAAEACSDREAWRVEDKFSRYLRGNIVHRVNRSGGEPVGVDGETARLIDFAESLYSLSDGRFDITSGVLREAWVFDGSDNVPSRPAVRRHPAAHRLEQGPLGGPHAHPAARHADRPGRASARSTPWTAVPTFAARAPGPVA